MLRGRPLSAFAPRLSVGLCSCLGLAGCGALATWPAYTGGGYANIDAEGEAAKEAELAREAKRIAAEPRKVGAKHILVQHEKSMRKPETVTRTKDAARLRALECLARIRRGERFDSLVAEYSDEPGSAERKGDLGLFARGAMVKAFSDAVFALRVGDVSEVVETSFGFHIILRTE